MSDDQYSWLTLFKKIIEFCKFIVSFFRGRKEIEKEKEKEKFNKAVTEVNATYDEIDKDKQAKKEDDLNKRLKNLF